MEAAGSSKRTFLSIRRPAEDNTSKVHRPRRIALFRRASSALGGHRVHHLSDLRQTSASSKAASVPDKLSSTPRARLGTPTGSTRNITQAGTSDCDTPDHKAESLRGDLNGLCSRATSALSLPLRDVPERRSSTSIFAQNLHESRQPSQQELPQWRIPPAANSKVIPNRGRSNSPVRRAAERCAQSSQSVRLSPVRTIIRTTPPLDILDKGNVRHERLGLSIQLPSPLFVSGGTVEGQIYLDTDRGSPLRKSKLKPMLLSRLSIDILGVEEVNDGRRWVFLSLGSELIDETHPPPPSIVQDRRYRQGSAMSWILKPASGGGKVPFCLNLPLNIGPPPYLSKQACIRYLLVPTVYIQIGEKRSIVRQIRDIQMLTVYDPKKALTSLPSPLLAADSLAISQVNAGEVQSVRVTGGLHRQTWVDGAKIFVDVHIANHTTKILKKVEIQLEKTTLWYAHAAAGTIESSAGHLRLPKRTDVEIIAITPLKKSKDWRGVPSYSSEVRTYELDVPRGNVTISTGRYFEVRFYVNVLVFVSRFKSCTVQLPVTLIHINSLDVPPNALAQVAASIEARRTMTVPVSSDTSINQQYYSGQAFTAPRLQSLEQARAENGLDSKDVSLLTHDLDKSPRKFGNLPDQRCHRNGPGKPSKNLPNRLSNASAAHHHHKRHPSCYHCHLIYKEHENRPTTSSSQIGPSLPRLQVSTSGLGFFESEFEVPPDSPRKVMLSEQERKMIHQQRELKSQREYNERKKREDGEGRAPLRQIQSNPHSTWKYAVPEGSSITRPANADQMDGSLPTLPMRMSLMASRKSKDIGRGKTNAVPGRSQQKTAANRQKPRSLDNSDPLPTVQMRASRSTGVDRGSSVRSAKNANVTAI